MGARAMMSKKEKAFRAIANRDEATITRWYVNGELVHTGEEFDFPDAPTGEPIDIRCEKTVSNKPPVVSKSIKHNRVKDRSRQGKEARWK